VLINSRGFTSSLSHTTPSSAGPPWNTENSPKVAPFEFLGDPTAPNVVVVAMTAIIGERDSGYITTPPMRTLMCRLLHSAALNNVPMAIFGYEGGGEGGGDVLSAYDTQRSWFGHL
jgi:hypothetical protein